MTLAVPGTGARTRSAAADRTPGHGEANVWTGVNVTGRRRELRRNRIRWSRGELSDFHPVDRPAPSATPDAARVARPHGHTARGDTVGIRAPRRSSAAEPPRP